MKKVRIILIILIAVLVFLYFLFSYLAFKEKQKYRENRLKSQSDSLQLKLKALESGSKDTLFFVTEGFRKDTIAKNDSIKKLEKEILIKHKVLNEKQNSNQLTEKELLELEEDYDKLYKLYSSQYDTLIEQKIAIESNSTVDFNYNEQIQDVRNKIKILLEKTEELRVKPFHIVVNYVVPADFNNKEETSYDSKIVKKFKVNYNVKGCVLEDQKINIFIYVRETLVPLDKLNDHFFIESAGNNFNLFITLPRIYDGDYSICLKPQNKKSSGDCGQIEIGSLK